MDSRALDFARAQMAQPDGFARGLIEGLQKTPKEIPCKFFYDSEGSALFDAICALPEYYQTRTEVALLRRHAGEIAAAIGAEAEIVEFGAGALRKIRILLDALAAPRGYTPIDISGAYLRDLVRLLAADYPLLAMRPLVADFTLPLDTAADGGAPAAGRIFPRLNHRQFPSPCGTGDAAAHARTIERGRPLGRG